MTTETKHYNVFVGDRNVGQHVLADEVMSLVMKHASPRHSIRLEESLIAPSEALKDVAVELACLLKEWTNIYMRWESMELREIEKWNNDFNIRVCTAFNKANVHL